MAKTKEEIPDRRNPGPKSRRTVIPSSFQISRPVSPMRQILDEAEGAPRPPRHSRPSRESNQNSETNNQPNVSSTSETEAQTPPRGSRSPSPSTIPTGSRPSIGTSELPGSQHTIAPSRDFMRVANSITREAVPGGLFAGK